MEVETGYTKWKHCKETPWKIAYLQWNALSLDLLLDIKLSSKREYFQQGMLQSVNCIITLPARFIIIIIFFLSFIILNDNRTDAHSCAYLFGQVESIWKRCQIQIQTQIQSGAQTKMTSGAALRRAALLPVWSVMSVSVNCAPIVARWRGGGRQPDGGLKVSCALIGSS